ncbi:unnamed protein product [Musa acuminata var. zebrina]
MGCTQSRLEPDEEVRSNLQPRAPGRRRIQDIRLRRRPRDRKGSLISSAEVLPESSEAADDLPMPARGTTAGHPASSAPLPSSAEGKKKAGLGPRLGEGGKGKDGAKVDEGEEAPGSPSFRFYFDEPLIDQDSAVTAGEGTDQGKIDEKKEDSLQPRDDTIKSSSMSQEPESKSSKKDKGNRFKALSKGSSVVYNQLMNR